MSSLLFRTSICVWEEPSCLKSKTRGLVGTLPDSALHHPPGKILQFLGYLYKVNLELWPDDKFLLLTESSLQWSVFAASQLTRDCRVGAVDLNWNLRGNFYCLQVVRA